MRSFADADTVFEVVRSDTPVNVDGFKIGEPTGEIVCLGCGESHVNIDEIPHAHDCTQRFVHSEWYASSMQTDR